MQNCTFLIFAAVVALALAEGQFYVPRSYYIIDAEGHESAPVPLRRLRRSLQPYPYASGVPQWGSGASANANANANAQANGWSGADAHANANANAQAGGQPSWGGWGAPSGSYGATNPALSAGQTRRLSGPVTGAHSVQASSSVGLDSSGQGYYDQYTSVSN
ncbi:uncharacterized protein LOC128681135 [Plodia interpunctella]|uniref:uncharacterized protein LOC128681135 n=1 Tax=Plodia interpunctella TaxID=58824 RepID=UPI00236822E3|nr:uncharacterized protein LOC128681135 [Plodia interpunctella]